MTPIQWHRKRAKAEMPHVAESMLDLVQEHGPIKITDFILQVEKDSLGSRAHLYFNLSWLRENGFVKATSPANNLRVKEINITSKGARYLEIDNG
jgi:DNA-binding PadR family transcriptional regulator